MRGLAFLGFPLHPAGKPSDARAEHLSDVRVPMLFLQGTRDALADLALLRPLTERLGARAALHVVQDADHSFHVPARSGRKDADVRGEMLDALAAWTLAGLSDRFGLRGVADPAGLPLLLLAAGAVSFVMMPVAHAVSRAHERRADRFALDLTKNPGAFISAMRRLGAQNLAEEHPSKLVQWLFYSHPPVTERIAAARAFSPQ